MCPKDFVSNRYISNIFEGASPLRDKLEFIGLSCSDQKPHSVLGMGLFVRFG